MKKLIQTYIIPVFALFLGLSACDEFQRTLDQPPVISFLNAAEQEITSITANGQDLAIITIDLGRLPYSEEKVTVSTNHGALFELSETAFDSGMQSREFMPFRQIFSLYLQAGTSPEPVVEVVVSTGSQTAKKPIAFSRDTTVPAITFESLSGLPLTELAANGTDKAVVRINLGTDPASNRDIELTTTHGSLFAFNATDFSSTAQTLTVSTTQQETMAILQAGTEPIDEVLVTATVSGNKGSNVIPFAFDDSGCPALLNLISDKDSVSIVAGEVANLVASLSREDGLSNEPITLTFSVTHSALGSVSPETLTFEGTDVSAIFTPLQAGTATITVRATDARSGCAVQEGTTVITVTN